MIVEDQRLFRDLLKRSLASVPHLNVVGDVGDGAAAVQLARKLKPDVVLMDIELGQEPNGITSGVRIKEENPNIGIVLLTTHDEKEYLSAVPLEQSQGWSYVLKQSVADLPTLVRAIEGAASGLLVLDPSVVKHLRPRPSSRINRLTPRQHEVLDLIAQGFSNDGIAQQLFLSGKAVENHIKSIYENLNIGRDEPIHPRVKAVLVYLNESSGKAL